MPRRSRYRDVGTRTRPSYVIVTVTSRAATLPVVSVGHAANLSLSARLLLRLRLNLTSCATAARRAGFSRSAGGPGRRTESVLRVETVRIRGGERPAAQSLQPRVGQETLDQELPQTLPAVLGSHEQVADIGVRRVVGRCAREPRLPPRRFVEAERQRIGDRSLDHLRRDPRRPVGVLEERVDEAEIESLRIGRDLVATRSRPADDRRHGPGLSHRLHMQAQLGSEQRKQRKALRLIGKLEPLGADRQPRLQIRARRREYGSARESADDRPVHVAGHQSEHLRMTLDELAEG